MVGFSQAMRGVLCMLGKIRARTDDGFDSSYVKSALALFESSYAKSALAIKAWQGISVCWA